MEIKNNDGRSWRFTGIYGESRAELKLQTWALLHDLYVQHEDDPMPWRAGDFNEVLFHHEKEGGVPRGQSCLDRFREALEGCDLHDLGFTGDVFTWRNKQFREKDYIRERLDRAVANGAWRECFPLVHVKNGDHFHSDHRPVVVYLEGCRGAGLARSGESAFKFEASWLQEERCADVVAEAWEAGDGWGEGKVGDKLRSVVAGLHSWNVNVLGDLEKRIKKLRKELERCRRSQINVVLVQREAVLSYRLDKLEEQVDIFWRQ